MRAWSLVIALGLVAGGLPLRARAAPAATGEAGAKPQAAKPAGGAEAPVASPEPEAATSDSEPGTLVLPGDLSGPVTVRDAEGRAVATVAPNTGHEVALTLPPGDYTLAGAAGPIGGAIQVDPGARVAPEIPGAVRAPGGSAAAPPQAAAPEPEPPEVTSPPPPRPKPPRWRPYVAPVLSALLPGSGQMLNGDVGKGMGVMLSTAAFIVGAVTLARVGDPTEGAGGRADDRRSVMQEVSSQVGFAAFTGALGFLYVAQIADAHNSAAHRRPTPRKGYRMRMELARMSTISARPGQPSHRLLNDWTVSFMGQPVRRLAVGLSDVGITRNRRDDRTVFQGGLRLGYRVFDKRRFWIDLALGTLLQGAILGDDVAVDRATHFGAAVYGQLGLRLFVFDWMSLGILPRLSVPLTTRVYAFGGSIPRYAPTLELGLAWGVYF